MNFTQMRWISSVTPLALFSALAQAQPVDVARDYSCKPIRIIIGLIIADEIATFTRIACAANIKAE